MKKSLKKLLFILLALLSVFLIVSCGDKPSKKEVIEKFVENSKNMKSADVTVNMKMEQKNSASPAGIFMEATGDLSLILEPNLAMKMNLVLPFNNNKLTMYLKDDYSYVQNPADNQWIKQSNKGFSEQFKKAYAQSNAIYDFLIKNIDKIDLKKKGGNYLLTIKDFKDLLKKEFSTIDPTGSGLDGFEDMVLTFTVDKKTFLPVNFTMTGTINVENIKMNISFDVNYSNINNVKEIVIPKEALEAKEINPLEEIEKINVENKK
ncbi:DUF6612 family protein [Fusobacterium animalis]|uniref:DUF6612 family protein n=1 Tax=Fusobacterium animalis TaxID=76859 RepID=UPI0030CC447D